MNVLLVAEPRHNLPLLPLLVTGGVAGAALLIQRRRSEAGSASPRSGLARG